MGHDGAASPTRWRKGQRETGETPEGGNKTQKQRKQVRASKS